MAVMAIVVASCNNGPSFGIDVSQYNGEIDWAKVKSQTKAKKPIEFVIVRATVGVDRDTEYTENYVGAKKNNLIVGSYHYYRPNESSVKQFENFLKTAKVVRGDIIPVVDIEAKSSVQSMNSLKAGLRNFIDLVEQEYGVKPIIYTKLSMWKNHLREDFSDCKLWVAAYSNHRRGDETVKNAAIHQFTKGIRNVPGIPSKYVDGDDCRDISSIIYWARHRKLSRESVLQVYDFF